MTLEMGSLISKLREDNGSLPTGRRWATVSNIMANSKNYSAQEYYALYFIYAAVTLVRGGR